MAALQEESAFSSNGQYFAHSSSDGRLRIWEANSGTLKQEYIPSAHLSAYCTCMCWSPSPKTEPGSSRKKKKQRSSAENDFRDVIALGTAAGTILLYSVSKGDLVCQFAGGHTSKVTGLCWSGDSQQIFSCGKDRSIIQWDVRGNILSQWKMDKGPAVKLTLLQDDSTLVTAGRAIQCWDVQTRTVVASFTGHVSDVLCLSAVNFPIDKAKRGGYFLSAAVNDRSICVWKFAEGQKATNALASFALQDEPVSFEFSHPASKDTSFVLTAVTKSGSLHVFEHHLNGSSKKPIQPKVTINIGSETAGNARPLPVLASYSCGDSESHVQLVYGSFLRPAFEKICSKTCDAVTCLVRRDPLQAESVTESSALKTRAPAVTGDVKFLTPGFMAAAGETPNRKRRTSESAPNTRDALPMEQRLSALSIEKATDAVAPPQADNLAQLLLQGLQSRDSKLLQSVLDRGDETVINNTVRRIPVQSLLPLLSEISRMLQYKGHPNHSYAKWLRSILQNHAGYLTSCPDLVALLSPMMSLMTARTALFPKLSLLRGRLDLMLGQLERRLNKESAAPAELPAEALLVYQEDSSAEESDEGDWPVQSGSESEDQWDEMSDMEVDTNESKLENEHSEDEPEEVAPDVEEDEIASATSEEEEESMENGLTSDEDEEEEEIPVVKKTTTPRKQVNNRKGLKGKK